MKPFQERVVKEKEELDVKIAALESFTHGNTFEALPGVERGRLMAQWIYMLDYSGVLGARIAAFKDE